MRALGSQQKTGWEETEALAVEVWSPPGAGPLQPELVLVLAHVLTSVAPWASIQSRSWPAAIIQWMSEIICCSGAARISLILS